MFQILYSAPQKFEVHTDLTGLFALQDQGFHICQGIAPQTAEERYEPVSRTDLRQMWQSLLVLDRDGRATFRAAESIWRACYVVTKPGLRKVGQNGLAAVISTDWRYCAPRSFQVTWHLRLGLDYSYTGNLLPAEAIRLVEFAYENGAKA
jgi:hypothetical protein